MLDITCRSSGMTLSEASFDLGDRHRIDVRVEYQSDRFHRVSAVWIPSKDVKVPLLEGFDTYLDMREREVVSADHIARTTSPRMFAHTLHGRDWRRLLDAGVIS
jgi:hypothetical protein